MCVDSAWFGGGEEQTFNGEIMDSPCAKNGGHEAMFKKTGTNDPKACTEACVKMGGKYVLFNGASKTFYQLDDQTKPQAFRRAEGAGYGNLGQGHKHDPRRGYQSGIVGLS